MAKQLNVNLTFNADTKQAKAQIDELSKALRDVAKLPGKSSALFDDASIKRASQAALELEQHLAKAVNVNTGKLDLSRFSSSLKASNKDLQTYYRDLIAVGKEGQQAFMKISSAIASAEMPTARINAQMSEFLTTLKNTARWQISSSILHGLQSGLNEAIRYAKDLDESLNNIRIVTGASVDEMARFAETANRAARALNTTTTEYTNAALIFYQQGGFSDEEIQQRTETTIKMANVSRQSAEIVSDQMTAIWNNFYDGSKSVEYYADVIAKLGAETASSSDEIAQGLEKFAAVSQTVGLSYEYATAALATVTAETRQSADVVGTAFKTLFARIQDLELGETLEDGTTLGKYSAALGAIGINIKTQNGELKEMDDILSEMGTKWGTLSKDQQVALAQTVAGTRQYTQLIALMDNWGTFQDNLKTATEATGTLQEQANIYAESWEAARDNVKAAAQDIYDSLIDEQFLIKVLELTEKVLDGVGGLVDGFGGLGNILNTVAAIFLSMYAKQMPEALNNLKQNLMVFTGAAEREMLKTIETTRKEAMSQSATKDPTSVAAVQLKGESQVAEMKRKLTLVSRQLTQQQRDEYEAKIENVKAIYQEIEALAERTQAAQAALNATKREAAKNATNVAPNKFVDVVSNINTSEAELAQQRAGYVEAMRSGNGKGAREAIGETKKYLSEQRAELEQLAKLYGLTVEQAEELGTANQKINPKIIQTMRRETESLANELGDAVKKTRNLDSISIAVKGQAKEWTKAKTAIMDNKDAIKTTTQSMAAYVKQLQAVATEQGLDNVQQDLEAIAASLAKEQPDLAAIIDSFDALADKIEQDVIAATMELDTDITNIRDKLNAMGVEDNVLDKIEEDAFEAATEADKLAAALSNAEGAANVDPTITHSFSEGLAEVAGAAMAVVSAMETVKNTYQVVFNDESATPIEKIGAALGAVVSVITTYGTVTRALTSLTNLDTAAKNANAIAANGAAIATRGFGAAMQSVIPVIGLVLSALTLLMGALNGVSEANKQAKAEAEANAKAQREAARVEAEANGELVQSYLEKIAAYKETHELSEGLIDDANELCSAYEIEGAALAELTEDYNELTKAILRKRAAEIKQQIVNWQQDHPSDRAGAQATMDDKNTISSDGYMQGSITGMGIEAGAYYGSNQDDYDPIVSTHIKSVAEQYGADAMFGFDTANGYYGTGLTVNPMEFTRDNLSALYEQLSALQQSLINDGSFAAESSTFYLNLTAYLNDLSLALTQMGDQSELIDLQTEQAVIEETLKGNEPTTEEEYRAFADKIIDAVATKQGATEGTAAWDNIVKSVESYLATKSNFAALTKAAQGLEQLADKYGFDKSEVTDFYQSLTPEEKTVFWKIDFDKHQTENAWRQAIDSLQGWADLNAIEIKLSMVREAQKDFKKGMNVEEYREFETESGITWGQDGVIAYNEFLQKTYAEQVAYLQELEARYEESSDQIRKEGSQAALHEWSDRAIEYKNIMAVVESMQAQKERAPYSWTGGDEQQLNEWAEKALVAKAALDEAQATLDNFKTESFYDSIEDAIAAQEAFEAELSELGIPLEEFEEYKRLLASTTDAYKDNEKGLNMVALANKKLDKGVSSLSSSWEDYNDIMKESDGLNTDVLAILPKINDALQDVLNLDSEQFALLPPDFAQKHWDLIQDVVDGVDGAVDDLRDIAGQEILMTVTGVLNAENLNADLVTLHEQLSAYDFNETLEVGIQINDEGFIAQCNAIIAQAGMTAEQAQAYFAAMGYDAEVEKITVEDRKSRTVDYPVIDTRTGYPTGEVKQMELTEVTGTTGYAIKTITPNGTYGGGTGVNTTASSTAQRSGGGSKNQQKPKKLTKVPTDSRTNKQDKQLEKISRELNEINKSMDRAYGAKRLAEIDKLIQKEKDQLKALEDKAAKLKDFMATDKKALELTLERYKIEGEWDESGENLENWHDIIIQAYTDLNEAEAEWNRLAEEKAASTALEEAQKKIDEIKDMIEALEGAFGQYNNTVTQYYDTQSAITDSKNKIQDLTYDKIEAKLELKISINDGDLRLIERQIAKLEDDLWARADLGRLMVSQVPEYEANLGEYSKFIDEITLAYKNGEISQADYAAGLEKARDGIWENIDAIEELKDSMKEYYSDTLAAVNEEYEKYIAFMEHPIDVMDHYKNIIDLTGGQYDYKSQKVILDGIAKGREDVAATKKEYYEMMKLQAEQQKAQMAQFTPGTEAYEHAKHEWEVAQEYANQAEADMLSAVGDWAQAVNDVLDIEIAAAARELEKALTNGSSFDELNTTLERTRSLQEEWLTATDQQYQTTKMMRTTQAAIDKSTNDVAKQKLQAFMKQTEELQKQQKLSSYELEIHQAQYDLLVAQIALEEAQQAKSTVRLQRDSSGNFGYVYTADQDKVDGAQQAVDDAENNLYHKGLEGYNKYTEQYIQMEQEFFNTITEIEQLHREGYYESEEAYNQALLDAQAYYGEQLANLTYLANAGLMAQSYEQFDSFKTGWFAKEEEMTKLGKKGTIDYYSALMEYAKGYNLEQAEQNTIFQEGWATTFGLITQHGASWKDGLTRTGDGIFTQVNTGVDGMENRTKSWAEALTGEGGYLKTMESAWKTWGDEVGEINKAVGLSMEGQDGSVASRAEALQKIIGSAEDPNSLLGTTKSYRDLLTGPNGLITQLGLVATGASNVSNAFQLTFSTLDSTITKYEGIAAAAQAALAAMQMADNYTPPGGGGGGDPGGGDPGGGDPGGGDPGGDGTVATAIAKAAYEIIQKVHYGQLGYKDPRGWKPAAREAGYSEEAIQLALQCFNDSLAGGGYNYVFEEALRLTGGARTGAYTGEWGPWGKLAWIHEKELILNKEDTRNMLDAVSLVRDLMSSGGYINMLTDMTSPRAPSFGGDILEQFVTIEAHFPNVSQRTEIEAAFSNLINTASQFANRKRI